MTARLVLYVGDKGKDYKAWVYKSGTIKFNRQLYNSPSLAGKAIIKRSCNGWYFWRYKNESGHLVEINKKKEITGTLARRTIFKATVRVVA